MFKAFLTRPFAYGIGLTANVLWVIPRINRIQKCFTVVPSLLRSCPPGGGRQLSSVLGEGGGSFVCGLGAVRPTLT